MATGRIDDRSLLSQAANAALDGHLDRDESVLVIIRGQAGTALVGTDRRAFVWQDRLTAWPYAELTGLDASLGLKAWVALRGPGIPLRDPGWTTLDDFVIRPTEFEEARYAVPLLRALITAANVAAHGRTVGDEVDAERLRAESVEALVRGTRDMLSKEANRALDAELATDEAVRAIIRGQAGTALIGTDRRVLIWKRKGLHSWTYAELSSVEVKFGFSQWIALRGPGIEPRKPGLNTTFDISPESEAEARHRLPILESLIAEQSKVKATTPADEPAPIDVSAAELGATTGAQEASESALAEPTIFAARKRLSKEANLALNSELAADEPVRVVVRGPRKSALIGTDRRALIWKDRRLRFWPYAVLSEVESEFGSWFSWAVLRGPSLGALRPTRETIASEESAIEI